MENKAKKQATCVLSVCEHLHLIFVSVEQPEDYLFRNSIHNLDTVAAFTIVVVYIFEHSYQVFRHIKYKVLYTRMFAYEQL